MIHSKLLLFFLMLLAQCQSIILLGQTNDPLGSTIYGQLPYETSGWDVAINGTGNRIAIGSTFQENQGDANEGIVRVYEYGNDDWIQIGDDLSGDNLNDEFGYSISLSGDGTILAVGARQGMIGGAPYGYVKILRWDGSSWNQLGSRIDGVEIGANFGTSVSLNDAGDRLAVGCEFCEVSGTFPGTAQLYEFNGTDWSLLGGVLEGASMGVKFGLAVSLDADGNTMIVGAPDGIADNMGRAYVYRLQNGNWVPLGGELWGEGNSKESGTDVDISDDGNRVLIGIPNGTSGSGFLRVFDWDGSTWTQVGADIFGIDPAGDFGQAARMNGAGDVVVGGSPFQLFEGVARGCHKLFTLENGEWEQLGPNIFADNQNEAAGFRLDVSDNGLVFIVGAPSSSVTETFSGSAKVYGEEPILNISEESVDDRDLQIIPNPVKEQFSLQKPDGVKIKSVQLFDFHGRLILTENLGDFAQNVVWDVSTLNSGIYMVVIISDEGQIVKKLKKL